MNKKNLYLENNAKMGFIGKKKLKLCHKGFRYNKKNGTFKSLKDNLPGASPQTEALEWSRV